jgi:hypothetical protein
MSGNRALVVHAGFTPPAAMSCRACHGMGHLCKPYVRAYAMLCSPPSTNALILLRIQGDETENGMDDSSKVRTPWRFATQRLESGVRLSMRGTG